MKPKTNKKTIIFPVPSQNSFVAEKRLTQWGEALFKANIKAKKIKPKFKAGALRIVEE